jgi:hypothetical protein
MLRKFAVLAADNAKLRGLPRSRPLTRWFASLGVSLCKSIHNQVRSASTLRLKAEAEITVNTRGLPQHTLFKRTSGITAAPEVPASTLHHFFSPTPRDSTRPPPVPQPANQAARIAYVSLGDAFAAATMPDTYHLDVIPSTVTSQLDNSADSQPRQYATCHERQPLNAPQYASGSPAFDFHDHHGSDSDPVVVSDSFELVGVTDFSAFPEANSLG